MQSSPGGLKRPGRLSGVWAKDVTELVRQAKEEAIREVIVIIKEKIKEMLLDEALKALDAGHENEFTEKPPEDAGIYLYGIVGAGPAESSGVLRQAGIDGKNRVYQVICRDLCGVVSNVSLAEFGEEALNANLQDMRWIKEKAFLHEHILEQVMKTCTVVPMKFCTIYKNKERLEEVLRENYDKFQAALRLLDGKEEWGVKIYFNPLLVESDCVEISEEVRELAKEAAAQSPGKGYFLKKKMDGLIEEEAKRQSFACADECYRRLSRLADRSCLNELPGKGAAGGGREVILNSACLVLREMVPEFKRELAGLEEEYRAKGLEFACSGPWPAYNFCWTQGGDGNE